MAVQLPLSVTIPISPPPSHLPLHHVFRRAAAACKQSRGMWEWGAGLTTSSISQGFPRHSSYMLLRACACCFASHSHNSLWVIRVIHPTALDSEAQGHRERFQTVGSGLWKGQGRVQRERGREKSFGGRGAGLAWVVDSYVVDRKEMAKFPPARMHVGESGRVGRGRYFEQLLSRRSDERRESKRAFEGQRVPTTTG